MYNAFMESCDPEVVKYYELGHSAFWVGKRFNISLWKVYKILKKYHVARRSPAQSNRLSFLATPLSFSVPGSLSISGRALWEAGLLLYLGEGSKKDYKCVDLANCDEEVIQIFLKMLRQVYRVKETRLRIYIYCHDTKDPQKLIAYWSELLHIPARQFTKPYIKAGSQGADSDKMKHGLVHIRYADSRLWAQIMNDMHLLTERLLGYSSGQREQTV